MNQEQVKDGIRWMVSTFGGVLAGYFAAWSGWFSADQIIGALNSPTFLALASSVVMGVWGLFANTKAATVAKATALPEVDSQKLAAAIDDPDLKKTATANA